MQYKPKFLDPPGFTNYRKKSNRYEYNVIKFFHSSESPTFFDDDGLTKRSRDLEISKDMIRNPYTSGISDIDTSSLGRVSVLDNISRFASSKDSSPFKGSKTGREENIVIYQGDKSYNVWCR